MNMTPIQFVLTATREFPTVESFVAWATPGRGFWRIETLFGMPQRVEGPYVYSHSDGKLFHAKPFYSREVHSFFFDDALNIPAKGLFSNYHAAEAYLAAARAAFARDPEWANNAELGMALMSASIREDNEFEEPDFLDNHIAYDEREICMADDIGE